MSEQVHKALNYPCVDSTADDATVCEIADDSLHNDTWILGSSAGKIDVYVSLDGTNYQTAAIALLDLSSLTPSTMVAETAAGGVYCFRGKFRKVKLLQQTDNVSGAALIGYRTT